VGTAYWIGPFIRTKISTPTGSLEASDLLDRRDPAAELFESVSDMTGWTGNKHDALVISQQRVNLQMLLRREA
jgi:hypothetical protein